METNRNETIKPILDLLKRDIQKVWSWGFSNLQIIPMGLRFKVNAFKLNGWVDIVYGEGQDLYIIRLWDKQSNLKTEIKGIGWEELVDTIDREIEYTGENYKMDIQKWFKENNLL